MSAHLLKAGSKRRRTKAEMAEQLEIEQLSNVLEAEREDKIKQLEIQLLQAQQEAEENKGAFDALTELVEKGEIRKEEDGSVTVIRGPNIIQNYNEMSQ